MEAKNPGPHRRIRRVPSEGLDLTLINSLDDDAPFVLPSRRMHRLRAFQRATDSDIESEITGTLPGEWRSLMMTRTWFQIRCDIG